MVHIRTTQFHSTYLLLPWMSQSVSAVGNLKNRRDVCSATEAGFIEYSSLSGAIKTGCQLSPCATSKFIYYHAPRVCCPNETDTALWMVIQRLSLQFVKQEMGNIR